MLALPSRSFCRGDSQIVDSYCAMISSLTSSTWSSMCVFSCPRRIKKDFPDKVTLEFWTMNGYFSGGPGVVGGEGFSQNWNCHVTGIE